MNAIDIARYFLCKANLDGDTITNLKMQKLLYYAQAWYLVNFDEPLYEDSIEAWYYGPAIHNIYTTFKKFGYKPIVYSHTEKEVEVFDKRQLDYLDHFYSKFIDYSAHTLSRATHKEDPWKDARARGDEYIENEAIKKYYKKEYSKQQQEKAGVNN